ncbi:MAG: FtsX-like permease family protein [Marinoscillum sp.]
MERTTPPKLPLRFLRWFCKPELLKYIEGDLIELYEENAQNKNKIRAKWQFSWEVIKLFRPDIIGLKSNTQLNNWIMFKNYLKVGMRSILKYKTFSFINIFGLAVAMSVALLVILMLADQTSYDEFHPNKERIYRILSKRPDSGNPNASSPFPLAQTMREDYSFVESATFLMPGIGGDAINLEQDKSSEVRGFFADDQFFDVFGFDLLKGEKSTALNDPSSIVISSEVAYKLFNDTNPIGKTVMFSQRGLKPVKIDLGTERGSTPVDYGAFTIKGVIDASQYKSHIKFDVLVSAASLVPLHHAGKVSDLRENWANYSKCYTYVELREGTTPSDLQVALSDLSNIKYSENEDLEDLQLLIQPLSAITPGRFLGNPISLRLPIEVYYFLGFLALVIMFSAGLNYTNLSIARVLTRLKEIGVRKVNGATRKSLIFQFLIESVLVALCALIIANLMLFALKPAFLDLWVARQINLDLSANLSVYLLFIGFAILVGLIAGLYPAMVLSRSSPIGALKNKGTSGSGRLGLRKVLSVTQFVFSLFFIITSILIVRQFRHFVEFEYGFNTTNIVNIPTQGNDYSVLIDEFSKVPGVEQVSASEFILATPNANGVTVRRIEDDEWSKAERLSVSPNYIDNMGLKLIAGQGLNTKNTGENWTIVNESMVHFLGFETAEEAVGQAYAGYSQEHTYKIVGVIADFKFQTPIMGEGDTPLILWYQPELISNVNVRLAPGSMRSSIEALETKWRSVDQVHPFSYAIYDEELALGNQWLGDVASVIGFIAFLAILISCMGLLGMAIYTSERRVKEVGIRKVLGASVGQLAVLLGKSFLILLIIAIAISAPLSYYANRLWLDNIPNQIQFGWGTVLISSLILMVLGILTIGSQIISISRTNPVESLKCE